MCVLWCVQWSCISRVMHLTAVLCGGRCVTATYVDECSVPLPKTGCKCIVCVFQVHARLCVCVPFQCKGNCQLLCSCCLRCSRSSCGHYSHSLSCFYRHISFHCPAFIKLHMSEIHVLVPRCDDCPAKLEMFSVRNWGYFTCLFIGSKYIKNE